MPEPVKETITISSSDDEDAPIAQRLERLRKKRAETTIAAEILKEDVRRLEERLEQEQAEEAQAKMRRRSSTSSPRPGTSRQTQQRRSRSSASSPPPGPSVEDTDQESVAERVHRKRKNETGED